MYAPEKMSSQMRSFFMMEFTEQTGKQLCLQKAIVDSSTRQKCWGWRKNPARWLCHCSQCVVKLQLSWSELSCHPPGLGSSFLHPHLSSANASLWPCCVLCVPGPQLGSLGGSKAMRSFSHWRSLLWDSSYLRCKCKAIVKLHPSCWGLSCYCQHALDEIWPLWNQLQTLIDGAGPGALLVLQVVPQLRKTSPFFFWSARLLSDNLEFSVWLASPTS